MEDEASFEAVCDLARLEMVETIRAYGVSEPRVLDAMRRVRRHAFIPGPPAPPDLVYGDHPLPIGCGQTISQPFIVAFMTAALCIERGARVLEVGCGSGYQSAVLAELGAEVLALERLPELVAHARRALASEGYARVNVRCADGYEGWLEAAPFDGIIVTCAPAELPATLPAQLADGGRLILPVGSASQQLILVQRHGADWVRTPLLGVRFVPMLAGILGASGPAPTT